MRKLSTKSPPSQYEVNTLYLPPQCLLTYKCHHDLNAFAEDKLCLDLTAPEVTSVTAGIK